MYTYHSTECFVKYNSVLDLHCEFFLQEKATTTQTRWKHEKTLDNVSSRLPSPTIKAISAVTIDTCALTCRQTRLHFLRRPIVQEINNMLEYGILQMQKLKKRIQIITVNYTLLPRHYWRSIPYTHRLGAVHDGSPPPSYLGGPGAQRCRWEDGYIMSDLRHTERGFRWSPCTIQSFHHFLK